MPRVTQGIGFLITGLAPVHDIAWEFAGASGKRQFWLAVARFAEPIYDAQLAAGIGANGQPLADITRYTRQHRRSAMGTAHYSAPPLTPAYALSRTRSFVRMKVQADGVWVYWKFDRRTGDTWGKILRYQATVGRDVFGLSAASRRELDAKMQAWWRDNRVRLSGRQTKIGFTTEVPLSRQKPTQLSEVPGIRFGAGTTVTGHSPGSGSTSVPGGRLGFQFTRGRQLGQYGPPPVRVGPGPTGGPLGGAKPKPGPKPAAPAPAAGAITPPPPASPVISLPITTSIPPKSPRPPIQEQVSAYGDAKRIAERLVKLGEKDKPKLERLQGAFSQAQARHKQIIAAALTRGEPADASALAAASQAERRAQAELHDFVDKHRARAHAMLPKASSPVDWSATIEAAKAAAPIAQRQITKALAFLTSRVSIRQGESRDKGAEPRTIAAEFREIPKEAEQRSYHAHGIVHHTYLDSAETYVHELGHVVEWQLEGAWRLARDFLEYRTHGEIPFRLKERFPDAGYKDDEFGREDQFGKFFGAQRGAYVGKSYPHGSTEILSMGLEALYTNPVRFARQDPEYFSFILGVLRGAFQ